jgi:prepilin-type N-terminal cleavage/methylation domain-containing protein
MKLSQDRGFSLLELMIVIVIGLTMASVAFMSLMPLFKENHVDQAYDMTLSVLRTYRNMAIAQSNRYVIIPSAPQTLTVKLWGYSPPPAASPAPVTVATYTLPQDIQYAVQAGFPNPGPDGFGTGSSFETFNDCAVIAGGSPCIIFYPDGSAQDDLGNYNSGVLYLTRPLSNAYSSRAIDIYGTTGRVRGWRLYNHSGTNVWAQQ